jgi:hypothetical protein
LIYQALQDGTHTRPGRRVKIVNFGLDPAEGLDMGLQVEKVANDKKRHPVGSYIGPHWEQWLQSHRIELNAMTTDLFLRWLDYKMEIHGSGKLIPPAEVATVEMVNKVDQELRKVLSDRILAAAGLEAQVKDAFHALWGNGLPQAIAATPDTIQQDLEVNASESWRDSVVRQAQGVVNRHLGT